MIYILIYIYLFYCVIVYDVYGNKKYFKLHYVLLFLIFTLVAGFRWRLGVDTVAYMNDFKYNVLPLNQLTFEDIFFSKYQPLWVLLNSFCKTFGNFVLMQILVSLILHSSIFAFLYYFIKKRMTALAVYYVCNYWYFSMEIMRESLAISCFLFAIIYLDKNVIVRFLIFSFLSFLFHYFSIFIWPSFVFLIKKISFKIKIALLLMVAVIAFLLKNVMLVKLLDSSLLPQMIASKILGYMSIGRFTSAMLNINGLIVVAIIPSILILSFIYIYIIKEGIMNYL